MYMYGENQSMLANTTMPESTLKKKSNEIVLNLVQEGSERGEWGTSYTNMDLNVAVMMTKPLPSGNKCMRIVGLILHHLKCVIESGTISWIVFPGILLLEVFCWSTLLTFYSYFEWDVL